MTNLVPNGKRMEDFPLPGVLVELEKSLGLQQVEHLLGDGHFAVAIVRFSVGDSVGINDALEIQRPLVGHALLVLAAKDVVQFGIVDDFHFLVRQEGRL